MGRPAYRAGRASLGETPRRYGGWATVSKLPAGSGSLHAYLKARGIEVERRLGDRERKRVVAVSIDVRGAHPRPAREELHERVLEEGVHDSRRDRVGRDTRDVAVVDELAYVGHGRKSVERNVVVDRARFRLVHEDRCKALAGDDSEGAEWTVRRLEAPGGVPPQDDYRHHRFLRIRSKQTLDPPIALRIAVGWENEDSVLAHESGTEVRHRPEQRLRTPGPVRNVRQELPEELFLANEDRKRITEAAYELLDDTDRLGEPPGRRKVDVMALLARREGQAVAERLKRLGDGGRCVESTLEVGHEVRDRQRLAPFGRNRRQRRSGRAVDERSGHSTWENETTWLGMPSSPYVCLRNCTRSTLLENVLPGACLTSDRGPE